MPSYKNTLQYLYGLERFGIRLGLKRVNALLKLLNNPHKKFPVIHVAGTNGKGSTSAMIASILQEAGCKVGLYTSPHLVRFNERIKVNGDEITDKKIVELTKRIKERVMGHGSWVRKTQNSKLKTQNYLPPAPCPLPLTFFEFTTAMAFLYFAEEKVDIAVVETGLGGRLDATNVCKPLVSIITNVSKEHEDILGKGIKNIAIEKGGIIKEGARGKGQGAGGKLPYGILITGATQSSVLKIFEEICGKKNAKFYRLGKDFFVRGIRSCSNSLNGLNGLNRFCFKGRRWFLRDLRTNLLLGRHQYKNAALAIAALEEIDGKGFRVSEDAVRTGLENVRLQGRLQIISREPTIVLDCAHNPDGAKVLRDALISESGIPLTPALSPEGRGVGVRGKRLIFVIGIMADKDINGFLSILAPIADLVILTKPNTPRAAKVEMLLEIARPFAKDIMITENVKKAYNLAKSIAKKDDIICITGSFYTVGEVLKNIDYRNF